MTWTTTTERLPGNGGVRVRVQLGQAPVSTRAFWTACTGHASAREVLLNAWSQAALDAFFWETPPLTQSSADRDFEFVLTPAPSLARVAPEPDAFHEHFAPRADVVRFENLGGDALLVVPCPRGPRGAYAHLAAFARSAPRTQQHSLVRHVGDALLQRLGQAPTWLSTSGLGVAWVHVRLDSRPKYYTHQAYTQLD